MSDKTRAALQGAYEQYTWAVSYATQRACTQGLADVMANLVEHENAVRAEAVLAFAQTLFPQEAARHAALMFAQEQGWSETPGQAERET